MRNSSVIAGILLVTGIFSACEPDYYQEIIQVEASFNQSPDQGATTTLFLFDAGETLNQATEDQPVFVRWDWDGDGIWDETFSTKKQWQHRFFAPGTHQVTMEASGIDGQRDTSHIELTIEQGYSAPFPFFSCDPDSSNLLEEFLFDASTTHDDEDSLETLVFRWDFDGDLNWDTPFSSNPVIRHTYSHPRYYSPILEVKDPSGLSAQASIPLIVNLLDASIQPSFTIAGGHFTIEDTIITNAEASSHLLGMNLTGYSWDFNDDGIWEAENETVATAQYIFSTPGIRRIRLRVHDERGLYMDLVKETEIFSYNTPPQASLLVSSHIGNHLSEFVLDGRTSYDRDESIFDLSFQWDVDGDGNYDPEWDNEWMATAQFQDTGTYYVKLRITDSGDKSSEVVDSIKIYAGNKPTGYILDKRGVTNYYGTVKIGNQWWMQENLRFFSNYLDPPIPQISYNYEQANFLQYGGLYYWKSLHHREDICPNGWHIPSEAEYQELFDYLGADNLAGKLLPGGEGEFHLKPGGWMDYSNSFRGMGTMTHLWTNNMDRQGILPMAVFLNTQPGEVRFVYTNKGVAYYVRCIQD